MTYDPKDFNAGRNGAFPPSGDPLSSSYTSGRNMGNWDAYLKNTQRIKNGQQNTGTVGIEAGIIMTAAIFAGPIVGFTIGNEINSFGWGMTTGLTTALTGITFGYYIDGQSKDIKNKTRPAVQKSAPKERVKREAQINLEKTRLKKKALAMQCKELHEHFSNGVVRSYYASLSEKKQIDFKRFFNDAYIHSGTPTSDNRVKEIDTDRLFDKILEHTRNGKFLHNVILQESSFHQKLDNLLNGIHKYELKQERAETKKVVLERKQARYKRMTPYRKISNVVTPVLNGLITTGILTSLFFVASQPQATANNSPAYTHYVTANSLKVRDGAGTQFNTASAPLQNDECIKVKNFTNNGWARIVLENNRSGFVHGDYIKRRPSGHRCLK